MIHPTIAFLSSVRQVGPPLILALTLDPAYSDDQLSSIKLASARVYIPNTRKGIGSDDGLDKLKGMISQNSETQRPIRSTLERSVHYSLWPET